MKKKALSLLLMLAMCLSLLPSVALAEDTDGAEHTHYLCGDKNCNGVGGHSEGSKITFTAWTDELAASQNGDGKTAANSLPKNAGYYYLTTDVKISTWKPANGTVLCLNGYSIMNTGYYQIIVVNDGVTFTLCDCNGSDKTYHFTENYKLWELDESGNHTVTGGIITNGSSGVYVRGTGTFNMYGGTIVGNSGTSVTDGRRGGGVYVVNEASTFNMYDGTITGNTASGSWADHGGGGVFVYGTFNMSGGEITNNTATGKRATGGGGVHVERKGTFNMSGGTIGGNGKGNKADYGGGVCVRESTFTMSGDAKIIGNEGSGAGVRAVGSMFTMSDNAQIANNSGIGVDIGWTSDYDGTFNMNGNAAITGNNGGGVNMSYGYTYYKKYTTFNVSGNVQITGNTKNDEPNNVFLEKENNKDNFSTITIGAEDLADRAKIGVTAEKPADNLVIATGATANRYTNIVTSDDDDYDVIYDSGKLMLRQTAEHRHKWNYALNETGDTIVLTCKKNDCNEEGSVQIQSPEGESLTYDGSEKVARTYSTLDLNMEPQITYTKDGETVATSRDAGNYTARITLGGVTASVTYIINKADPICNAPTVNAQYGQKLSDLTLTNPEGNTAGTWTWNAEDDTSVGEIGENTFQATFTPTDTTNYNSISNIDITVNVAKADQTISGTAQMITKNGKPVDISNWFTSTGDGALSYTLIDTPSGITLEGTKLTAAAGDDTVNNFSLNVVAAETDNYNSASKTFTVIVSDKEVVEISGLSYENKTYDGQPVTPTGTLTVSGNKVSGDELEVKYTGWNDTVYDENVDTAPTDAGDYRVIYKVADNNANYAGQVEYYFTINPREVTVAPKNVVITKGDAIPAFELEFRGLVAGDTLTQTEPSHEPMFTCFENEGDNEEDNKLVSTDTPVGTYTITWTNKDEINFANSNYIVIKAETGTLKVEEKPAPSHSSGGSHSASYPVSAPNKTENGTVSISSKSAAKGSTVTVTVKPDSGYQLDKLTVTDKNGKELQLTDKGDGKFTFTMPSSKVDIQLSFVEIVEKDIPKEVTPETDQNSTFKDVSAEAYYYKPVKWAVENGITHGIGDELFGSDYPCTRAQIVTFLWQAAGSPEPESLSGFTDVPADAYYAKAVAWAAENGIVQGISDELFNPNATCTRAQSMTFLFRASKAVAFGTPAFSDVAADAYYAEAVKWAMDNGITSGMGDGIFGSDYDCTRAQIVTFLWKMYVGK